MSDGSLIAVLVPLITAAGGAVAWLVNRHDKKADPIPKTAAELAVAERALGIIEKSASRLEAEVGRVSGDLEKERARGDEQQAQIDTLRADVSQIKALLSHATRYIETLLRAWPSSSAHAPAVPAPLHELIDGSLHPDD